MAYKVGTVLLEIKSDTAKLVSGMNRAEKSIYKLKRSFADLVKAAAAIYGITKTFQILNSMIIETSAKFEKFSLILETLEGNSKKAQADLEWIKKFAQTTPYEIDKVTEAFVKLKSYGLDAQKNLKVLGDTAAAMGRPLDMAVEAIADAVTGEFERLKAFGVKAYQQGEKVAFTWSDASGKARYVIVKNNREIIESTITAIWNSKYAGAMDKLRNSWDGIISNMKDAWTNFKADTAKLSFAEAKKDLLVLKSVWTETLNDMKEPVANFEVSVVKGFKQIILGAAILNDSISDVVGVITHTFKGVVFGIEYMLYGIPAAVEDTINGVLALLNKLPDWIKNKIGVKDFRVNMGWSAKRDKYADASVKEFAKVKDIFTDNIVAGKTGETYAYWKKKFEEAEREVAKQSDKTLKKQKEIGQVGQFNRDMLKEQTKEIKKQNKELAIQKNTFENLIALKKQDLQNAQELIAKFKGEYISEFGTQQEQLSAWYKEQYEYILKTVKSEEERVKVLKELNILMVAKMNKLQNENKPAIDTSTFEGQLLILAKKFGFEVGKTTQQELKKAVEIAVKSAKIAAEALKIALNDMYDSIKSKYEGLIDNLQQKVYTKELQSTAYNAFGQSGYGAVASYKGGIANIQMLQTQNAMYYELSKKAKEWKSTIQTAVEAAGTAWAAAGAAAGMGINSVSQMIDGINFAMQGQKWAEEITGFKNFQSAYIEGVEKFKQAVRDLAKSLIDMAGSVYNSIKDYRSLYDKITGTNTYKLQEEAEALAEVSKYTQDLSADSLAQFTQDILQAQKAFTEEAVASTKDLESLTSATDLFSKYGLAIDSLNEKFKDSLSIVADLIEQQREANEAISDYVAELRGIAGDTDYNLEYTQKEYAQALQQYYAGQIDANTLLDKAKAFQAAAGNNSDLINLLANSLEGVTQQSTEDYLKGILESTQSLATIGLPDTNIEDLTAPQEDTLEAIKDTNSYLEKLLDLFKGDFSSFFDNAIKILKDILNAITNIAGILFSGFGLLQTSVTEGVVKLTTSITEGIVKLTTSIADGIKDIVKTIAQAAVGIIKNSLSSLVSGFKNIGGVVFDITKDIVSSAGSIVSSVGSSIGHAFGFAEGGYIGLGTYTDATGERVAGVVHEGEWVAPKWMVNSFPSLFASLERARITKSDISIPALAVANNNVNVKVNLAEIQMTNSILKEQLALQRKMYRLLLKFDEEGIKCVS